MSINGSIKKVLGRTNITDLNLNMDSGLQSQSETSTPDSAVSPTIVIPKEETESEIGEKKNPTINVFNHNIDVDSAIVMLLLIFIWSVIWKTTGLWEVLKYDMTFKFVFYLFVIYSIINMFTSGNSSGSIIYELNILMNVEQMVSILFGTMVMFTLFHHNLQLSDGCKRLVFHIMLSIIIIMTIISLWVNLFNSGRSFRALRKFKQGIYNIALMLFLIVGLIYIQRKECSD